MKKRKIPKSGYKISKVKIKIITELPLVVYDLIEYCENTSGCKEKNEYNLEVDGIETVINMYVTKGNGIRYFKKKLIEIIINNGLENDIFLNPDLISVIM